jgi:prepilin-type N-terminal cleavage/methylation domain-containing protein
MRSQRGFSLPEILAAFLILSVVITTSLAVFVERNKRIRQASEMIVAYQALANEAEYQRRVAFDDLENDKTYPFLSDTSVLAPLAPFAAIVAVKDEKDGVKLVTLTVRWNTGKREARLVLVRTDTGGPNLW